MVLLTCAIGTPDPAVVVHSGATPAVDEVASHVQIAEVGNGIKVKAFTGISLITGSRAFGGGGAVCHLHSIRVEGIATDVVGFHTGP